MQNFGSISPVVSEKCLCIQITCLLLIFETLAIALPCLSTAVCTIESCSVGLQQNLQCDGGLAPSKKSGSILSFSILTLPNKILQKWSGLNYKSSYKKSFKITKR